MTVNYADYREVSIEDYDAVVVGAGFAGATVARQLVDFANMRVLVIEKRNHIAGNAYDEYDKAGILVHRYGPHIFHTDERRVFDWARQHAGFMSYRHRVLADLNGTYMPVPFNKRACVMAFGVERGEAMIEKLVEKFGDEHQVTLDKLRAEDDADMQEIADYVYKNIFEYYTQKQWGVTPDQIDPSIIARVPIWISNDDHYFQDRFQGMPVGGYTVFFESVLGHKNITVCLNTEAESVFDLEFVDGSEDAPLAAIRLKGKKFEGPIVYTGPLDELFLWRFGRLPYRTIDFVSETYDQEYVLPVGTVNYTVSEDFTRATEFKHITLQKHPKTTVVREYPKEYDDPKTQVPCYPVISEKNLAHYKRYLALTEPLENFFPLGRLAEYCYYNMDAIVSKALDTGFAIRDAFGICDRVDDEDGEEERSAFPPVMQTPEN